MDANMKARWITELLSGTYTQGQGQLRTTNGSKTTHCCMGVLAQSEGVDLSKRRAAEHGAVTAISTWGGDADDATPVELKALIPNASARLKLALLNDRDEFTFTEIADRIETMPVEYFNLKS